MVTEGAVLSWVVFIGVGLVAVSDVKPFTTLLLLFEGILSDRLAMYTLVVIESMEVAVLWSKITPDSIIPWFSFCSFSKINISI